MRARSSRKSWPNSINYGESDDQLFLRKFWYLTFLIDSLSVDSPTLQSGFYKNNFQESNAQITQPHWKTLEWHMIDRMGKYEEVMKD